MNLRNLRVIRGPGIWSRRTVLELHLLVGADEARPDAALHEAVCAALPALPLLPSDPVVFGPPAPAGSLPDLWARTTLRLQQLAGVDVQFARTVTGAETGQVRAIVEYVEEPVGRRAVELARQLLDALANGTPFDVTAAAAELRKLDQNERLGPSTGSIVRAAAARGIPFRRLNDGSLVQFGWGARQRRILAAETDRTSAIGESIAQDKELTKLLLRSVGVPAPEGRNAASAEEAWEVAEDLGLPVVVKPQYGNQGRGVAVNLSTREQVVAAWHAAREEGRSIMVERYAPGDDYRLLVVGDAVVAASLRHPPRVTGDGVRTVEQLVAEANLDPRRGEDHATSLSKIPLDAISQAVLAEQGYETSSVLPAGRTVALRRNANLSTGGTAADVTDLVHPEVAARAVDAARIVGLDIAGVDMVCVDISRPLESQGGVVVEVNAAPGLRMHLEPSSGTPRKVGEAIVGTLFGPGQDGRIPLVAVTGNNGKTTTTRLTAHLLESAGYVTGYTCSDGIHLRDRTIDTGDCSGPRSARALLMNPLLEAAVVETARGGLLREGLGYDAADVAIVTNIGEGDHLGLNGIDTVAQLAAVKGTLVENVRPGGAALINADDPLCVAMASRCPAEVIFFSRQLHSPAADAHAAAGGRAVRVRDGQIVLVSGDQTQVLMPLRDVPLTRGGRIGFQVDNVLAAAGAAWALKLPMATIRAGLERFAGETSQVPGRFNLRQHNGGTVVLDYAHNVDALQALVEAVGALPHKHRAVVVSAAGDRRDIDIVRQGEVLGAAFDRVVLYEDACNRGRKTGEVVELLRRGVGRGSRAAEVQETLGEHRAIEASLRALRPGDLLVVLVDQVESSIGFVDRFLAAESGHRHASAHPAEVDTTRRSVGA